MAGPPKTEAATELEWTIKELTALVAGRFYGKLTLTVEDGVVKRILMEKSLMSPSALSRRKE
jgi:hypothetical protein